MMFEKMRQRHWIRKNARWMKRQYLRWPYRLYKTTEFDDFNHEHTCLAVRFPNIDLEEICPLKDKKNLIPGDRDECEQCRYFSTICYQRDPQTGEKQIHLEVNSSLVTLFEEKNK